MISPRVDLDGAGCSPRIVMAVTDLPEPDSPTMANTSPRCTSKRHAVDGLDDAVVGGEAWPARSRTDRRTSRVRRAIERSTSSFGSSASRRPSPTNTKASTVRKMAMPGKNSRCGALDEAALAVGDHEAPRRRGRTAGRRRGTTAPPRTGSRRRPRWCRSTMIGWRALGRMWRNMMRVRPIPEGRAASTYSSCCAD